MAGTYPHFKLYQNDGTTLVYEFEKVVDWGDGLFQDFNTFAKHESLRGQGSIISDGSESDWELPLEFLLVGDDYDNLMNQEANILSTVVKNTQYILKVDITSSTTKDLKVKLLSSIRFPITNDKSKVIKFQRGFITFLVNCWA